MERRKKKRNGGGGGRACTNSHERRTSVGFIRLSSHLQDLTALLSGRTLFPQCAWKPVKKKQWCEGSESNVSPELLLTHRGWIIPPITTIWLFVNCLYTPKSPRVLLPGLILNVLVCKFNVHIRVIAATNKLIKGGNSFQISLNISLHVMRAAIIEMVKTK